MHIYKLECPKNGESTYVKDAICGIQNIKNGSYAINAYVDLIQPFNYANITLTVTFRSSNKVMFDTTFEYCSSYGHLPPFVAAVFAIIEKNSKNLIHQCPYIPAKKIGVQNFILEYTSPILTVVNFQRGDYKALFFMRDKKNNLIFYFHSFISINQKKAQRVVKNNG
jgi:hypothetical protein